MSDKANGTCHLYISRELHKRMKIAAAVNSMPLGEFTAMLVGVELPKYEPFAVPGTSVHPDAGE